MARHDETTLRAVNDDDESAVGSLLNNSLNFAANSPAGRHHINVGDAHEGTHSEIE
jgi:hypothetical protein